MENEQKISSNPPGYTDHHGIKYTWTLRDDCVETYEDGRLISIQQLDSFLDYGIAGIIHRAAIQFAGRESGGEDFHNLIQRRGHIHGCQIQFDAECNCDTKIIEIMAREDAKVGGSYKSKWNSAKRLERMKAIYQSLVHAASLATQPPAKTVEHDVTFEKHSGLTFSGSEKISEETIVVGGTPAKTVQGLGEKDFVKLARIHTSAFKPPTHNMFLELYRALLTASGVQQAKYIMPDGSEITQQQFFEILAKHPGGSGGVQGEAIMGEAAPDGVHSREDDRQKTCPSPTQYVVSEGLPTQKEIERCHRVITIMHEALGFYATKENYEEKTDVGCGDPEHCDAWDYVMVKLDDGRRAREALAEADKLLEK